MENILSVNLETSTAPIVQEVRGKDYIEYGTDDWRNLYPQFLIDLYYNSSTHAAIINATSEMIAGEELIIDDEDERDLNAIVKLKKFMAHPNHDENLHEIIKKLAFDFKLQGAFALNIIWSNDRTEISEIYHVPVEKIRSARPNEYGKVPGYFISADWSNTRINKPHFVPAFNLKDRTSPNQILYSGLYSPNMQVYHTPDYLAANNWALVDQRVAEFHLNNISNGFSGSYFISFANGVPTQEERLSIEHSLKQKFTGADNAGKFVLTFSDDRNRTPEITPISMTNADKQYLALQELLVQNILTGHRVTSPMLMGIKNDTGLGSNVDELNAAANYYLNTVVKPFQDHLIKVLRKIFRVNNMDMPVSFVQIKPITLEFTSEDLKAVMSQDEIREELGLAPIDEEIEVREDLAKVGSMVTDGVELPLFDSIEEAEAEAKKMGCSGHHEHKQDGKTYYMPCESHDQITSLSKCNCKTELSEFTALENFIEQYGEDIPEDWELIDDEIVDGEHQDFDFEKELNALANEKIEMAVKTGTARPNARDEQDGVNKDFSNFYKVRYIYTKNNALGTPESSRDFCKLMMSSKKVYRKEDILQMESIPVNPGWGPRGAATYSIWLYKGGGNCYHYWKRRIYKTSLRGAKSPLNDDQIITVAKARNEGFTIERNDSLVARAPKTMKNQGFLEPR